MANEIRADYEELSQLAQQFERRSRQVEQMEKHIKQGIQRLQGSWEGAGASAFFREMNALVLPGVGRLHRAFAQTALTVQRIAGRVRAAEEEAAALFRGVGTTVGAEGMGGGGLSSAIYANGGGNASMAYNSGSDSYQGGDPPATPQLSAAQVAALGALGIVIDDLAGATPAQIQNAIDFLSDPARISDQILDGGSYTGAELVEAVGILQRLDRAGIEFGQSIYNGDTWSLGELRQVSDTIEVIAQSAAREFVAREGINGLTALADYYGLPADEAHYAPLAVMMNLRPGANFEIRRDSENNVGYYGPGVLMPDGSLAVRHIYREMQSNGTWGDWIPYNPTLESHPASDTVQSRPSVWYARYDGNSLTFGNHAFDGVDAAAFTDQSLFAHELAHRMATETVFDAFDATSDDFYGNAGYENVPRSSNTWYEATPDLLANGLLGTFTNTDAGQIRADDYADVVTYIFEQNNPLPDDYTLSDPIYAVEVQEAMEDVGIWSPPPLPADSPFTPF